jgi:hypothetical protein
VQECADLACRRPTVVEVVDLLAGDADLKLSQYAALID